MTRFLHVANGTSTTRTIEAAGIPGELSIWADPLYDGPVPGGLSDEELLDVRSRYLAGSDLSVLPYNDMREWRSVIQRCEAYDELILWYEHDLFDQLNLIQVLTWIHERVPAKTPVSLVCIGSFPGRPHFKGLGELAPHELAPLVDGRQPVDEAQYALAARIWRAFREASPEALDESRRGDTSALPFLASALTRFLQEYPWTLDGLSRSERRLLELASGDGIAVNAAFRQMHHGEQCYYITDQSAIDLAEELSLISPPLLERVYGTATLTDAGRAVLAGQLDRVTTCGIDRWLGGVHLQGTGTLWRWDAARQRITTA